MISAGEGSDGKMSTRTCLISGRVVDRAGRQVKQVIVTLSKRHHAGEDALAANPTLLDGIFRSEIPATLVFSHDDRNVFLIARAFLKDKAVGQAEVCARPGETVNFPD